MKQKQPDLTIVIPAYHEAQRIGATLDELAAYLRQDAFARTLLVEVLVVAADSPDDTHKIVLSKQGLFTDLQLLRPGPKVGKGRDVQFGMLRARGQAVIYMDADLATPLQYLQQFYTAYQQGSPVIIGTRNLLTYHKNILRRAIANAGNLLFRVAGGTWIEDSQCGFKMFSREAAKVCFSKMTIQKWGFDMEIIAIARANRYEIKSYRINDWKDMPNGTFEDSIILNSLNALKDLAHIAINRMRGEYSRSDQTEQNTT